MTGLTDKEVDEFADKLELPITKDHPVQFANYPLPERPSRKLGIMRIEKYPDPGFRTTVSFGLVHESFASSNFPDRIETIQGYTTDNWEFEKIQVTVAGIIIKSNELPKPGVIYQHAVIQAGVDSISKNMPHAMIIFPYLWKRDYHKIEVGKHKVWFLQVVPVYDNELQFIKKNGYPVFEELLDNFGMRFHDLSRPSYIDM